MSELVKGNKILKMMVGLPRSGKSTAAQNMGHPIVNPDAIRLALHGQAFVSDAEAMVWTMAEYMIRSLFLAGHDIVILDATNITRERRDKFRSKRWIRWIYECSTPPEVCSQRARATDKDFLLPIIYDMYLKREAIAIDELLPNERWYLQYPNKPEEFFCEYVKEATTDGTS